MAPIVTVEARLKGAIVELIGPSYDRNLSMKCAGLSQGASSGYEQERKAISSAD